MSLKAFIFYIFIYFIIVFTPLFQNDFLFLFMKPKILMGTFLNLLETMVCRRKKNIL